MDSERTIRQIRIEGYQVAVRSLEDPNFNPELSYSTRRSVLEIHKQDLAKLQARELIDPGGTDGDGDA